MPLPETMYCSQQINVPSDLPDLLKQFTKGAIKTQPPDVLRWASAYFTALLNGEPLPVKNRFEMLAATQSNDTGLTPGLLKVLHKQLSSQETVMKKELQQTWHDLCLSIEQLETLLELGNFENEIHWMQFFALGCSALGGTIISALKFACEILTEDPDGGAARIPFKLFTQLFTYLAELDGEIPQDQIDRFLLGLQETVAKQRGMIQVTNFCTSQNETLCSSKDTE